MQRNCIKTIAEQPSDTNKHKKNWKIRKSSKFTVKKIHNKIKKEKRNNYR